MFVVGALSEAEKSNAYASSSDYNKAYAFDGGIFSQEFLGEPAGKKHPIYNIVYEGFKMGVYYCEDEHLLYVSNKPAVGKQFIDYALSMEDHTPNYNLAKEWRNNTMLRMLRDGYVNGAIRFANARCRYCVDTFFAFV